MQIDPAALGGGESAPASAQAPKSTGHGPPQVTQKSSKALISVPRLDLEPLYTELKVAIGENWTQYKEAVVLFLLGHLNQGEFASRVDHFLCRDQKLEHLHNNFTCAIIGNLTRDLPDHGVAGWVSANDKLTVVPKPASGDAAEQRLKTEIMQLPPKDRRRLKIVPEADPLSMQNPLEQHHRAEQIRLPDQVPASAGGLNKTNWELEIRKRYAQPLASETGEFPDAECIHARMVPICYEESVVNGAAFPCAAFMAIATENFIKGFLSSVFSRTRSNGPSGTINGTKTHKYRRQLEQEQMAFTRGELVKNSTNGLLPVEAKEASGRQALGERDIRLSLELHRGLLGHMPLVVSQLAEDYLEEELDVERHDYHRLMETVDNSDRLVSSQDPDDMDIDEAVSGWEGGAYADREHLGSVLDECLSMAA